MSAHDTRQLGVLTSKRKQWNFYSRDEISSKLVIAMLQSVLLIYLMVAKVTPDSDVCDGESEDCDDKPKSVFLTQKSEYIPRVQGNYEPSDNIDHDSDHGEGPGAGGQPVLLSGAPGDMHKYGMSEAVSDLISLSRTIPDTRVPVKIQVYKEASVYLSLYSESWLSPLALP